MEIDQMIRQVEGVKDWSFNVGGRWLRTARLEGDGYRFLQDPQNVIEPLRRSKAPMDVFTFVQKAAEPEPRFDYVMEWDNWARLPLTTYDNWLTNQIDGKTRNIVRKAEKKGIQVREVSFDEALVRGIWEVYNECPVRQGKPFRHYGMTLEEVRVHASTFLDCSIFLGAFLADEFIGFMKLTLDEAGTQANVMHILSMMRHRDKAPTNALIAQAVRSCCERGLPNLVYSNFSFGKKQEDSLSDFKRNNGFAKVDVPRYYVPLTLRGRMALRLGLHRGLLHIFPESIGAQFRKIRNAWYSRKLPQAIEAR